MKNKMQVCDWDVDSYDESKTEAAKAMANLFMKSKQCWPLDCLDWPHGSLGCLAWHLPGPTPHVWLPYVSNMANMPAHQLPDLDWPLVS